MSESVTNVTILFRPDPWETKAHHPIRGLLLEPDLVMVPDPPEALIKHDAEFSVAIAPGSGDADRLGNEWQPRELTVISDATGRGTVAVAFIRLAEPAPYQLWHGPLRRSALERALAETGSLWAALARVDPVCAALPPVADEDFAELAATPVAARRPLIRHEKPPEKGCGLICHICVITHICK
jgi:hypothetical protein